VALQRGEIQGLADSDPAVWLTRLRSNGDLVEIASNLSEGYANLSCCTLGLRAGLYRDERPVAAAVTFAIRDAAAHVAANPDDAAAVFSPYTPNVPVSELTAMLRSHTHNHNPMGAELQAEVVKIAGDLQRAKILKPTTDTVKLAQRIVVDVQS
jgi:NitT/TauT family transport system substrate-binding protein